MADISHGGNTYNSDAGSEGRIGDNQAIHIALLEPSPLDGQPGNTAMPPAAPYASLSAQTENFVRDGKLPPLSTDEPHQLDEPHQPGEPHELGDPPTPPRPFDPQESWNSCGAMTYMDMLVKEFHLSPAGAAALVGSFAADSHMQIQGLGDGFGLVNWMGRRVELLRNFAAQHHLSPFNPQAQFGFLIHELENHNPDLLNQLRTTSDAASTALRYRNEFVRPGTPDDIDRQACAQEMLKQYESQNNHH